MPTLRRGDVVIMDNLSSHKRQAIRAAIRAAGARLLFLPAYSPDLNPIEQVFAKIRALLRKAKARSIEDVDAALGALLDDVNQKNVPAISLRQDTSQPQASML